MFKRRYIILVFAVILGVAIGAASFLQRKCVVPILMYHSVDPGAQPKNLLAITPGIFERQMRFLKEHHYRVLTLEALVDLIKTKSKIPPKTVVVTLDDGYKDNYLYAYPILKKYNLPATIFIIFDEVGRPQNDRLSWDEIKAMQDSGLISFGCHTFGPEPLVNLKSESEVRRQIFDSKKALEGKLGCGVTVFSYPEGFFTAKIRQMVIEAGYKGAVATNPGKNYPNDDIFVLKRLRISRNAGNMLVFAVETSGYYTFLKENKKHGHGKK